MIVYVHIDVYFLHMYIYSHSGTYIYIYIFVCSYTSTYIYVYIYIFMYSCRIHIYIYYVYNMLSIYICDEHIFAKLLTALWCIHTVLRMKLLCEAAKRKELPPLRMASTATPAPKRDR